MASAAQIEPNHLKFGPFSAKNCVRPEESQEYTRLSKALWKDLNPVGAVEQMLAVEIVRSAWRLHRCVIVEAEAGDSVATQAAVDRARASNHNSLRRLLADLRELQSDRWLRAEVVREGFDEQHIGIADAHQVIKGLADNDRLKSRTIQTQLFGQMGQAISSSPKEMPVGQTSRPVEPTPIPTLRTQSAELADQALPSGSQSPTPGPQSQVPRNAPCPCHSGLKYKRYCGTSAPPVLKSNVGHPGPLVYSTAKASSTLPELGPITA
jgi:hypothetical protein